MEARIEISKSKSIIMQVKRAELTSSVSLQFDNETESLRMFQTLRDMGIKCYHAGHNAPEGASIFLYPRETNITITIK